MRSIGGWKTISTRVKLIAVVAVLLMVFSSAVVLAGSDGGSVAESSKDANAAYTTTVTYMPGTPDSINATYNDTTKPSTRTVEYYGNVISTEYNPQVWADADKWYEIKSYTKDETSVFIGWKYSSDGKNWTSMTYDPGEVLRFTTVNGELGWYIGNTDTKLCGKDGSIYIQAQWDKITNVRYSNSNSSSYGGNSGSTSPSFSSGSCYTNFYLINSDKTISSNTTVKNCTVRAASTTSTYTVTMSTASLSGAMIFDNVRLNTCYSSLNNWHGDASTGIFANGNTLIFGDGIKSVFAKNMSSASYKLGSIFGGTSGSTVTSTKLIFHSGIYSTVVGGSSTVSGNTYIVINGATLTDTLLGGGQNYGTVSGDAWIFATGLNMVGDYYEEHYLDNSYSGITDVDETTYQSSESSIFTGGSNNGSVKNTHIYLSGKSSVWDLQGSGRRYTSQVSETANIEISGRAVVKHVVNGSITDGNNSNTDKSCVKDVIITVTGESKVASVYGAGFDTFYQANKTSMMGTNSSITINIKDGTVGYVYGGGYRGTIGTSGQPLKSIDITISGGKILHDVFGGGRGGVDKTCHNADGTNNWSESAYDYTGHSEVYTNSLTITVSGGTVGGNVYGGGESVPWLSSSYKITGSAGGSFSIRSGVASTHLCNNGKLSIDLDSGEVKGSVYGAGKGISTTDSYVPCIYAMGDSSSVTKITEIPWLSGNVGKDYMNKNYASTYLDYAKVEGTVSVSVGSSAKVDGSVYGGGAYGIVSGSTDVTVSGTVGTTDSETDGNVYGAGQGVAGSTTTIGQVTTVTKVLITDSANVYNSIYGGGAHGKVTYASEIPVTVGPDATVYKNVYGGGFGSETYTEGDGYVAGSAKVTIEGTVKGNVYGGGAFGVVAGSTGVIVSGTVGTSGSETDGNVYGGGQGLATSNTLGKVGGDATVSISGSALGNVYGGGAYGIVTGSTGVTVAGTGKVGTEGSDYGNVYGAGQGVASSSDFTIGEVATVTKVLIEKGANVYNSVYGGGAHGRVTSSDPIPVTIESDATVYKNVYGGGFGSETYTEGDGYVAGSAKVTIAGIVKGNVYGGGAFGVVAGSTDVIVSGTVGTSGSETDGNVYGGGQGVASGSDSRIGEVATVTGVSIKSGAIIYNSVYGGGAHGNVTSVAENIPVIIESGATVYKNVFGGGYGDSTQYNVNDGYVAGSTEVTIAGTVKGNVYGGGGYGVVNGATSVSVTGTVDGTVYGGGFGFSGEKSNQGATVTITGGKVGVNVYGGARNGKSEGNTSVTITSATVGGTVYGGGLGSVGVTSVTGTSSVTATSSNISGSVYGAAENGIVGTEGATVDQTSSVTLDSTTVGKNVFGGGVGKLGVVSVYGKTSVEVKGDTTEIGGSVYGAAENGFVTSSQVTLTSGTVKGDVYGAGLGAVYGEKIQVSVTGDVAVTMSGGTVKGLLYGGAAYGQVQGSISVILSGGTIENTVYAGGKGTTGYVSVNGSRKIHLCGTKINGSLYGGSALGTDANKDNKDAKDSDAYVYIESGYVKGSVFGGGFQGLTYGSTYISIGKYAQASSLPKALSNFAPVANGNTEITIGESVYLGGDVGVVETGKIAYTTTMVYNATDRPCQMSINGTATEEGETVTLSISGSLMGSGNSCNTDGKTNIHILGFKPASGIESVHRVTDLTIEDSIFSMSGRATVDENSSKHIMDSMYSLYKIGNLVLKDGSTITLNASMENVGAYSSLNANGDATQKYTPLNKIVIGGGNVLAFRQITTAGGVDTITYSKVTGYTIVTVNGEDGTDFGGYILGSTDSTGGFMVYHEGSFKAANYYDSDKTRCWYLAGTITQEVTVTVSGTDGAEAIVSLPRLQTGTQYRYTGGTYITGAPLKGYEMISKGTYEKGNQFSVLFGYGNKSVQDIVLFGDIDSGVCAGTYLADYTKGVTPVLGDGESRNSIMYVKVAGNFTGAEYVGYVLVYINECRAVTYSEGGEEKTMYVVVNTVQTKINIYSSIGSTATSVDLSIGTVDGNGTGQLLIESGYPGREVSVISVTPDSGNVSGNVTKLYLESSKNADNTLGWTDSKGEIPYYINGTVTTGAVGTLQGGYQSTLLFSVRDFGGTTEEIYRVVLRISDGTTTGTFEREVVVHIEPVPDVEITFNGIKQGDSTLSLTYSFHYGITISEEDCPPGGDNFVGWYTDKDFNNPFSYSTPLTQDLELYALYMYTVTFDHMDGTTSVLYVSMSVGLIGSVENPVREGYDFIGWFTSTSFATKWDLATQKVTSDMTLYAYWVGKSVSVTFWYPDATSTTGKTQLATTGTMTFGDKFDVKITSSTGTDKEYLLTVAQSELEKKLPNVKFIYWVYKLQYDSKDDKSYAVYTTSYLNDWKMVEKTTDASGNVTYSVALCAYTSDVAVKIVMDPKIYDESTGTSMDLNAVIDPPSEFLAFPYETGTEIDYKTFKMKVQLNGATRPGYNLEGWSLDMDSSRFISGKDYKFLTGGDITITLAALSRYDGYPYSATFTISSNGSQQDVVQVKLTQEEYYLINPSARPTGSTASTTDPFTFSFKSHWEHIPYTVTIADMENGTIKAFYEDASGNYVYFTTGTFYYGEKFNLIYSANEGYQFSKWKSTGEGVFEDTASAQTTYVVQSDGVISAYAVGPQIVTLQIQIESTATDWIGEDGKIDRTKIPKLALSKDGSTIDSYVTAQAAKHTSGSTTYLVTFSGTANLGLHKVALCGTDGTIYDLGLQVESTTTTNVYYITATAPTGVAADHLYLGKVIYVENAITDDEKGLKSYTEFLLQYTYSDGKTLKNDTSITMALNSGYYVYYGTDGKTVQTDTSGNEVRSAENEATFELKKDVSSAVKLEGIIGHTVHNLTVNYVYGSEILDSKTGSVGYGELYWDVLGKLPTEIIRTESGVDVTYSVTSWVIGNSTSTDYINSSTVCDKTTFGVGITITANLEKHGNNYITLHVMQQDISGDTYAEKAAATVYADSSNNLEYQMLVYDGFDCINVKIGDKAETPGSATLGSKGLVKLTWTENKDVYVYLDRYTVTVKLWEHKEGQEVKTDLLGEYTIRYGGYLELPVKSDTDEKAYGSWAVGGKLSGTVRDGAYSATLDDVLAYLGADADSKANDFYLSIGYSTPTFSVTFITPYGKITQSNGTATQENTMFDVDLVKGTTITNDSNVLIYAVNGVTYSYSVSTVTGYTFKGWDTVTSGSTYTVNSDVIITAKWDPKKYDVKIYYDGYETKYTGSNTVKDITATVGSGAVTLTDMSEVSKTWTFNKGTQTEVEYTYKLGKQFSTQVEYGSWVTIAVEFESKWSLDTDKLKVTNSGMTYAKGSDLQHYTVSMFANGDGDTIEIYLTSMYSGATIFWNLSYTDEDGQKKEMNVLQNTDAQIGEAYFQKFFESDVQEIKDLLAKGYYYDGWYYNGQGLTVKQESGSWGYNVSSVPNANIYLYAYAYKVKVNGIDTVYDGNAHSVTVDVPKSDLAGDTVTWKVTYTYESTDYGDITVTNVADELNNKTYNYTVTITKAHTKLDGTGSYTFEQVLTGTVGVYLKPNVVYLVVDNSLAAKSTIPTTDTEYQKWLKGKETYTTIGLVEGETLEVTGWSVEQKGSAISEKISDYGVYDLIPTYKLTYTVGSKTIVITNETDNPAITVKVINGFITVNKTGYSSIIA